MLFKAFIPTLTLSLLTPAVLAETVAKTYPVKDFSEFVAGGGTSVEITQDGTEYLRVEADAEVMKRVKVDQTGKRVSVWVKSDNNFFNWFGHDEGQVRVVLNVKHLEYLELSGGAQAKVGSLQEDKFAVSNSGAASAEFSSINAGQLHVGLSGASNARINSVNSQEHDYDLSGAANLEIKGQSNAQSLSADVSGASNLRAKLLTANKAKVEASGASHIELTVTEELIAEASGASSINYYGNPKATTDSSGASHINAKN